LIDQEASGVALNKSLGGIHAHVRITCWHTFWSASFHHGSSRLRLAAVIVPGTKGGMVHRGVGSGLQAP